MLELNQLFCDIANLRHEAQLAAVRSARRRSAACVALDAPLKIIRFPTKSHSVTCVAFGAPLKVPLWPCLHCCFPRYRLFHLSWVLIGRQHFVCEFNSSQCVFQETSRKLCAAWATRFYDNCPLQLQLRFRFVSYQSLPQPTAVMFKCAMQFTPLEYKSNCFV